MQFGLISSQGTADYERNDSLNENNKYMYELHYNNGINLILMVGWSHGKGQVQYPLFAMQLICEVRLVPRPFYKIDRNEWSG